MDRTKKITKTFHNIPMNIMNTVKVIKEVRLTLYETGEVSISFEEYNRVLNEAHEEWMRKSRSSSFNN